MTQNRSLNLKHIDNIGKHRPGLATLQVGVSMTNLIFCLRLFDLDHSGFK